MSNRVQPFAAPVTGDNPGTRKDPAAHLSRGPINFTILREFYRLHLAENLNEHPGAKALVLDQNLAPQLNNVCEMEFLKQNGVEAMHYLMGGDMYSSTPHLVYLMKGSLANTRTLIQHIHTHIQNNKPHIYTVLCVPRATLLIEKELTDAGVRDQLRALKDFPLDLLPLEPDLLSLENDLSFREMFIDGDPSVIHTIARSIMRIQKITGTIPIVKGKGGMAMRVYSLMQRMRRDYQLQPPVPSLPHISALLLIDRSLDLMTPMLTPNTYEGLLDEFYNIKFSLVDVDPEVVGDKEASGKKKFQLTSNDPIFLDTRDMPFRALGPYLHKKAALIQSTYDERHSANTTKEMKDYMSKFKSAHNEHFLLTAHLKLAEKIAEQRKSKIYDMRIDIEQSLVEGNTNDSSVEEYIENAIAKKDSINTVLRLLALLSLTNGIRAKKYEQYKRDLLQTYGYEHIFTIVNMEKLGLISQQKRASFANLRKTLKLVSYPSNSAGGTSNPPANPADIYDISYVYGGYAPLLCRLIELAIKPGWKRLDEIMTLLPGQTFEYRQDGQNVDGVQIGTGTGIGIGGGSNPNPTSQPALPAKSGWFGVGAKKTNDESAGIATPPSIDPTSNLNNDGSKKKSIVLVYFIGGVTLSEVNALRWLGKKEEHDFEYIVATTKIINGNSFIEGVSEPLINHLNKRSIFK